MRNAIPHPALLPLAALVVLLLAACHRTNPQTEALFHKADSLLAEHPDSALRLLESLPATTGLTHRESARYALLLAQATDKCEKSLLPCDSLLDVALDYYDNDERERAVALLYKGRLEIEMAQSERAIHFLLEGLNIIGKFPEEVEAKRHLLSSLGNEYYNAQLYEKAGKAYKELYKCCFTDKDKAIALNGIGSYYSIIGKGDSALLSQRQAMECALTSRDSSIIALSAHNLSAQYIYIEEYDTALYHAKTSLQWFPQSGRKRYIYYNNIGNIFYYKDNADSAVYYIDKSLKDSTHFDLKEKSGILLDLSYIKKQQEDYQATTELLYQFIEIADSVYFTEQSTQIQQLIHQYDIKQKIDQEQRRSKYLLKNVIGIFIILSFVLVVFFQYRINKRDKQRAINEQKLAQTQERYTNLQHSINESQRIINLLQKEQSNFSQKTEKYKQEIIEREIAIEKLKTEKESLRTWLFKQSSIYKKVEKLSKQKVDNKKELTVLTNNEQKTLKEVIRELYADYISDTKNQHPLLTDEDLLYLCLEKVGFSNQTIALCFGNTDTHALAQRRYRIKTRMNEG